MRRVVLKKPYQVELEEVQVPRKLKSDELLLKIHRIGICGSDIHMYYGKHPFANIYPMIQGHEYGGEVIEVGSDVDRFKVGMIVTARPHLTCGLCPPCRRGKYNICHNLQVEGCAGPEGAAQEYFIIPADRAVIIPEGMTYDEAAMIEPIAVAVHATKRCGPLEGKNVVIAGAGTIGNLVAQLALIRGCKKALITDIVDSKLSIAKDCGIQEVANVSTEKFNDAVERFFGKEGFQTAFEAAGVQSSLTDIISGVEKGGTIIIIGVYVDNPVVNMGFLGEHELRVLGSMMYLHEDYLEAIDMVSKGLVKTSPLITQRFPLAEYDKAYQFIEKNPDAAVKVMIEAT